MIANWPPELPRPNRDNYQHSVGDGRLKRNNEIGPPGYRGRSSAVPDFVSMTLDLSRNELARFWRFYTEEITRGSKQFYMPDPTTSGWKMLTSDGRVLTDHRGRPLLIEKTWRCRFGDTLPNETIRGNRFLLNFEIVVMP